MKLDIQKFKLPELFNDSNGKTSPTLTAGFIACMVSLGGIMTSGNIVLIMVLFKIERDPQTIGFLQNLLMQMIALFGLGGSMLGIHRLSKDKPINEDSNS
jgi:hypothetical protein